MILTSLQPAVMNRSFLSDETPLVRSFVEACSILVPFLRVACRNTAVWVPLKQVEVVISVINDAEGKREISEMMRKQLSGWRKKLESVTLEYMKARICEE